MFDFLSSDDLFNGWNYWHGEDRYPVGVAPETEVYIRLRCDTTTPGKERGTWKAGNYRWKHIDSLGDIVAYQIAGAERPAVEDDKPSNPKDIIATNKLPMSLVSPIVRAYQAISHHLGNVKYGAWNWRVAGARASVYTSALVRHVDAWWEGEKYDPVDGTPHLANAQACLDILIEAEETGVLEDDRPPSRSEAYARVRKEMEELMPKIRAKYADKNPKHYTIKDTK